MFFDTKEVEAFAVALGVRPRPSVPARVGGARS